MSNLARQNEFEEPNADRDGAGMSWYLRVVANDVRKNAKRSTATGKGFTRDGLEKAVLWAKNLLEDDESDKACRRAAANLLFEVHRTSLTMALEVDKRDRADKGQASQLIKVIRGIDDELL